MNVLKVGGAVLKNREGFKYFLDNISKTKKPVLVIVSAFDKSTRNLSYICDIASKGHEKKALALLRGLIDEHKHLARKINKDQSSIISLFSIIDNYYDELSKIINGISLTKEISARVKDIVLSYGESLALLIISSFLNYKNIRHKTIDAKDMIVTDDTFGKALPNEKATMRNVYKTILPALDAVGIVLMQGFVARTKRGDVTTMGIESSNLTAVLMAKIIIAKRVVFLTDVNGIRNVDPDLVAANTKLIEKMNYADAYKAGMSGLKLIYPPMISFIRDNGIELVFQSAFDSNSEKTIIKSRRSSNDRLITVKKKLFLCKLDSSSDINSSNQDKKELIYTNLHEICEYISYKKHEVWMLVKEKNISKLAAGKFDYSIEKNISLITIFNVSPEQFSTLLNRKLKDERRFISFVKIMDINRSEILVAVKDRQLKAVMEFLHRLL